MTYANIYHILTENKYIAFRHRISNRVIGVNSNVPLLNWNFANGEQLSPYISYRPISFMEYISIKIPFKI